MRAVSKALIHKRVITNFSLEHARLLSERSAQFKINSAIWRRRRIVKEDVRDVPLRCVTLHFYHWILTTAYTNSLTKHFTQCHIFLGTDTIAANHSLTNHSPQPSNASSNTPSTTS